MLIDNMNIKDLFNMAEKYELVLGDVGKNAFGEDCLLVSVKSKVIGGSLSVDIEINEGGQLFEDDFIEAQLKLLEGVIRDRRSSIQRSAEAIERDKTFIKEYELAHAKYLSKLGR